MDCVLSEKITENKIEYFKNYRLKNREKINEYQRHHYHSKKKRKEEEKDTRPFGSMTGLKDDHTVGDEEIKSIDLVFSNNDLVASN